MKFGLFNARNLVHYVTEVFVITKMELVTHTHTHWPAVRVITNSSSEVRRQNKTHYACVKRGHPSPLSTREPGVSC